MMPTVVTSYPDVLVLCYLMHDTSPDSSDMVYRMKRIKIAIYYYIYVKTYVAATWQRRVNLLKSRWMTRPVYSY
jgi:hypothetical protein